MDYTANDGGYGFVSEGFSTGPAVLGFPGNLNTPIGAIADYSGPTPTDGTPRGGLVSMGEPTNMWQAITTNTVRFHDAKEDDGSCPGMLVYALNAYGQNLHHGLSTHLTEPMLNYFLELASLVAVEIADKGSSPSNASFTAERQRLLVPNPMDGRSHASEVMRNYSLLGRRGHETIVDRSLNTKNILTYDTTVLGSTTVFNNFAPKVAAGDLLYHVIKSVMVNKKGVETPQQTASSAMAPDQRQIVQVVAMSNGKNPPMGQALSAEKYQEWRRTGTFMQCMEQSAHSRDFVEYGKPVQTRHITYEWRNGKVVTVEDSSKTDIVYLNLLQIGEIFRVGSVWEPPLRMSTEEHVENARRSHVALAAQPTMRIVFEGTSL